MKSVVLLSGGVDSAVLLHQEHRAHAAWPLFIDYGQRAAGPESQAARAQCAALGLELKCLDMAAVGAAFREGQAKKLHVPLPHRNLVALSLGLSYATQVGAERLALAINADDTRAYPSASQGFVHAYLALCMTLGEVALKTPLAQSPKSRVVTLGAELGVDFRQTYSCLLGYAGHCGRCPQCLHRREAFAAAGLAAADVDYRA